jgi:hypothetical protein
MNVYRSYGYIRLDFPAVWYITHTAGASGRMCLCQSVHSSSVCVCDLYMTFIAHPADYIKGEQCYTIAVYIPCVYFTFRYKQYCTTSLQMALVRRFQEASTCHTVKFGSLDTDRPYPITHAESVGTRFGPAILLSIRD